MRVVLLLVPFLLASCDAVSPGLICTLEYVVLDVEVVDSLGRPVPGMTTSSVNERTGEALAQNESLASELRLDPGRYILASDSDAERVRVDGDPVRFTASGGGLSATAEFVLSNDGCHIRKETGPDRVVAQ